MATADIQRVLLWVEVEVRIAEPGGKFNVAEEGAR